MLYSAYNKMLRQYNTSVINYAGQRKCNNKLHKKRNNTMRMLIVTYNTCLTEAGDFLGGGSSCGDVSSGRASGRVNERAGSQITAGVAHACSEQVAHIM
jgi:hypothetical protein